MSWMLRMPGAVGNVRSEGIRLGWVAVHRLGAVRVGIGLRMLRV